MIEPGELHRYFAVRETATGREVWLENWDVRYAMTGGESWHYRISADGGYLLVRLRDAPSPYACWVLRPADIEPLPDGRGLWHPDHLRGTYALSLSMSYGGSWRQFADRAATPPYAGTDARR